MTNKSKFKQLVEENITRDGINNLMKSLENTDFYEAPASTRFHDSFEGGLVYHSIRVFEELVKDPMATAEYSMETLAIVALFHDLCKVGFYGTEMRNRKVNGRWTQVPFYTVEDQFPMGHGEKSVIMAMLHLDLTEDEMFAIRWHMGGFVSKDEYNYLSKAMEECPLVIYLHSADLRASYSRSND